MHEIVKCSCGVVLRQCRCFHPEKSTRIVVNGCKRCETAAAGMLAYTPLTAIVETEKQPAD